MRWVVGMAGLLMAAALSACGGGGGDSGTTPAQDGGPPAVSPEPDDTALVVMASVVVYDLVAGPERMMAQANAFDRLAGPAGAAVTTSCASGSITTRKTSATSFELTAANCKLSATDGLVYDGTWAFSIHSNSYGPDGNCTQGFTCTLQASVRTEAARFGYGSATDPLTDGFGGTWQQGTSATGVRTVTVVLPGVGLSVPDVGTVIINGTTQAFTVDTSAGQRVFDIRAAGRSTLTVRLPIHATLALGATRIDAAIDDNRDGTTDRIVVVPWSEFL